MTANGTIEQAFLPTPDTSRSWADEVKIFLRQHLPNDYGQVTQYCQNGAGQKFVLWVSA